MHRFGKAITERQQVYFYLSVYIYIGRIPNREWAHLYVWRSHWQTYSHMKVENGGTDSVEKSYAFQKEVREKGWKSTIVTFQHGTMNRIRTHTLIFPACLCLAPSYSQESHLRKTGWDIPALLSRFWQGAHTHTHTHTHTHRKRNPEGLQSTVAVNRKTRENDSQCLCILGTARGGDDLKEKKKRATSTAYYVRPHG